MKKRICCLLIGLLCLLMLAACGTQGGDNSGENTDPQNTEIDILKEVADANTYEALLAKYGKVAFRATYTLANGEISSDYRYQDSERYVYECDYYMYIDENGDVYGFDNDEKIAYRYLFVEDSYVEYDAENRGLAEFIYLGDIEKVVSQEEKDGIMTIYTSVTEETYTTEAEEIYLFEVGSVESIETVYEVYADTYELISVKASVVLKDGTEKTVLEDSRVSEPETYVVDEQLLSVMNSEDKRTVTVVAHPGTEQEKTYSATIAKGNSIKVYVPADGDQVLYTDEACTNVYEGDANLNADLTLYYK